MEGSCKKSHHFLKNNLFKTRILGYFQEFQGYHKGNIAKIVTQINIKKLPDQSQ